MKKFLDLGNQPLANSYLKKNQLNQKEKKFRLEIGFNPKNFLVSILNTVPKEKMFNKNYIYGEFLYDYKNNKLKIHKILRKIFQNIFLFFFNILIFRIKHSKINAAKLLGINKFIFFYLRKNLTI